MKPARKIALIVILGLLGISIYGLVRTSAPASEVSKNGTIEVEGNALQVDRTPMLTAQRLAQMPTSAAEQPFAQEALRLGDQEMDVAFAAAVLQAVEHPPELSAEAKATQERLDKAEEALAAGQAEIARLTAAQSKARGTKKDALDDQIELAKAQLELDQDEVDDAKQDLIRAGGDPQGRVQRMTAEHEAASRASDATRINLSEPTAARGLINRARQWSALRAKQAALSQARHDAAALADTLQAKHDSYEQQLAKQRKDAQSLVVAQAPASQAALETRNAAHQQSAAMVTRTKRRAAEEQMLANFDKRIDNEKQLAKVYAEWIEVVAAQQRSVLNHSLRGLTIILLIALGGLFVAGWIERAVGKMSMDRRQVSTVRVVSRVLLQVFSILLLLLVIFGPPNQIGTYLGLVGAGLTVALKDFIIAFFGWFVLMGKNGIRLGDWVEINGVAGEVVELGVFHTVLLETGNWTDLGHPTGRRVTFTNNFAIEGHYFNFSTSGQWLWDELQIVLPAGRNPYPIVDSIEKTVTEATSQSSQEAEREWRTTAKLRDMNSLSLAPAINVKPVIGGTQISVRYIIRASERYQMRARLNHAAVDLLGLETISPQTQPRRTSAAS